MAVIGLTGLPCAGKTEFVELARKRNFVVHRMGDAVWNYVRNKNLELNNENVARIASEERERCGKGIWAERTLLCIKNRNENIVIDGIRNIEEVEIFKKNLPGFVLVAIHSSLKTRFQRIIKRGRVDDVKSEKAFHERDKRELSWGIEKVIASADFVIVNEGSIEEFRKEVEKIFTCLI